MGFDWNSVGPGPAPTEIEVTVIGPGFGEAIAVHLGAGRWVLIDSCIDSTTTDRLPASERYLRTIGVSLEDQVDLVVATHWHDDHIRGIGRLVEVCRAAKFSCSLALLRPEFRIFVEQLSSASVSTNGAKLRDFRHALNVLNERDQSAKWAGPARTLRAWSAGELGHADGCVIRTLSPSDREICLMLAEVGAMLPTPLESHRAAVSRTPNLASVVVHIEFNSTCILLGADMETHRDANRGWTAAIAEAANIKARSADIVKIPHHGSVTGHHSGMWASLVADKPLTALTPFNRLALDKRLPTNDDIRRISGLAPDSFSTSPRKALRTPPRDAAVERSLRESGIAMRSRQAALGVVRFRCSPPSGWTTELFPPACHLSKAA